ncbi:MAG: hypothetical protein WC890_02725 [Candidatus Margulisiibacteriota bacterium]
MAIRRLSERELRSKVSAARGMTEAPPAGIGSILRSMWPFAKKMANAFAKETGNPEDNQEGFLKNLVKRFT